MTSVLLWKEYRQQRTFWLAILVLAVLLVVAFAETQGQGNGWQVYQEERIRPTLNLALICLMLAQGIVSGALLLAGEYEDGTLVLLDSATGQRTPVWLRKCLAGMILTLSQSLALMALAAGLQFP